MDESQPATHGLASGGQPRPPRPVGPSAEEPGRPAVQPSDPAGHPPVDLYVGFLELWKRFLELAARCIQAVRTIRALRLFRTSSALVRWVVMVVAIGFGAALLVALTINLLVSLIPSSGG